MEQPSLELNGEKDKDKGRTLQRTSTSNESGDQLKRPFGAFRSIMETLSGNQNNNNNYQAANQLKTSTLPLTSLGRKTTDAKGNPASSTNKGKNKAVSAIWRLFFFSSFKWIMFFLILQIVGPCYLEGIPRKKNPKGCMESQIMCLMRHVLLHTYSLLFFWKIF